MAPLVGSIVVPLFIVEQGACLIWLLTSAQMGSLVAACKIATETWKLKKEKKSEDWSLWSSTAAIEASVGEEGSSAN